MLRKLRLMKRECYSRATLWLALLACLFAGLVAAAGPARAEPLRLDGQERVQDASGHLERLIDPDGGLDVAHAAAADGWTALPGSLSSGFTPATIWLRLPVQVDKVMHGGWMLRLSNSLLDDVRIYVGHAGGRRAVSRWRVASSPRAC
jgi:hypothetical protein